MGAFLDKPETEKTTHSGVTSCNLNYALSCMQGWRTHMEDAHTIKTHLPNLDGVSFFAVFDGHGGKTVAQASGPMILPKIMDTEAFASGEKTPEMLGKAIEQGLFLLDSHVKSQHPALAAGHDRSGSTVVTAFVTPSHIIVGNCGDSRALIVRSGSVHFYSKDHKPSDAAEVARIKAAGGFVEIGRVCGNLAVSRALGDFEFKDRDDLPPAAQKISAQADIYPIERHDSDQFLMLACDGVWDVISNEGMAVFVLYYLKRGRSPEEIAELVLDYSLQLGSKDNMTALLVLLPGHPKPDPAKVPPETETEEEKKARLERERQEVHEAVKRVPGVPTGPPMPAPSMSAMDHDSDSDSDDAADAGSGDKAGPSLQRRTSEAGMASPRTETV